jgi:hypothetical protein
VLGNFFYGHEGDFAFFDHVDGSVRLAQANGALASSLAFQWFVVKARNFADFLKSAGSDISDPEEQLACHMLRDLAEVLFHLLGQLDVPDHWNKLPI